MAGTTSLIDVPRSIAASNPGLEDKELLRLVVEQRDKTAAEALIRRHGRLVFSVCRRVLDDNAGGDDAFQGTFLVLLEQAAKIRVSLDGWLFRVAHRTAVHHKKKGRKEATGVSCLEEIAGYEKDPAKEAEKREQARLVDAAVASLPEKLRDPIVLCFYKGHTQVEAARLLGRPCETVKCQIKCGKARLKQLLGRRVIPDTDGASLGVLIAAMPRAVPSVALINSTVKTAVAFTAGGHAAASLISASAASLAQEVLRTMFVQQVTRIAMVVLSVAGLLLGGFVVSRTLAAGHAADLSALVAALTPADNKDAQKAGPLDVGMIDSDKPPPNSQFVPPKSDEGVPVVRLRDIITGKQKTGDKRNLYFLVNPASNADALNSFWVQQPVERVGDDLKTSCQFGEGTVGVDEYFAVTAIATDQTYSAGDKLDGLPTGKNVAYSKVLMVKRTK